MARVPDNEGGFVGGGTDVVLTDGTKRAQFVEWVEALPASNPPTWLGLPDTAELMAKTNAGGRILTKLSKVLRHGVGCLY